MKVLGKIKWVGGYSNKYQKELDYGFIETEFNEDDVWFNIKDILQGNDLKENDYVVFCLNFNKKKKKYSACEIEKLEIENYIENIKLLDDNEETNILYKSLKFLKSEKTNYSFTNNCDLYEKLLSLISLKHLLINESFKEILDFKMIVDILDKDSSSDCEKNNFLNTYLLKCNSYELDKIYKDIPSDFLKKDINVFNKLFISDKVEYVVDYFTNNDIDKYIKLKINSLNSDELDYLEKGLLSKIQLDIVNKALIRKLKDSGLWDKFSIGFKNKILINVKIEEIDESDFNSALHAFKYANINDQERYIKNVGLDILRQHDMVKLINPYKKQDMFFNGEIKWTELCSISRILCIYRIAKENRDYSFIREYKNSIVEDKILHALCIILFCKSIKNIEIKTNQFIKAHNLIQEFVIEQAWDLDKEIDLSLIIPICGIDNTRYCDSREWKKLDKNTNEYHIIDYCPRRCGYNRSNCNEFLANLDLEWYQWSLKELLSYAGIVPYRVEGLSRPNEYVNKLGGWVNRLNSIRQRLKCSYCGTPFKPNLKYAKNLAKFTTTVLSCINDDNNHDKNIYFNQCWHCKEIIDSRESNVYIDGYYLCIHCGAGPIENSEYIIGSTCPKCGSKNMNKINDYLYSCNDCNHTINISRY